MPIITEILEIQDNLEEILPNSAAFTGKKEIKKVETPKPQVVPAGMSFDKFYEYMSRYKQLEKIKQERAKPPVGLALSCIWYRDRNRS